MPNDNAKKTHAVFTIVESGEGGERAIWRRVGSAYRNRDGSLSVYLDALPINGKLHIREVDGNEPK